MSNVINPKLWCRSMRQMDFDGVTSGSNFIKLTHIGKLSGHDTGNFPETFSKIYDFK